ncbi:ABC transporter ATP-binding protein [Pukyongiella litopenaei]|uniref:ABC transporter ATP-binding protein n=1 Tax=Pukyongiella litopenaei TaxID=2605946 RepID=A0A5C2H8I5_9RHOB|nr:ABC transporter ATP-binding protein [Pukyongiella litopenaei]QEP30671.1 ABC transporter ATP-binding protein [Pukyongiella litopenaei]
MSHLLEVRNLQTHFHTPGGGLVRAVNGVSFCLDRGETLGIVGESGSGKSVTSLSIMRLLPRPAGFIAGGEIKLEGRDLLAMSEREMRRVRSKDIAMIFQDPMTSLNPVVPVGRQITESLKLHMDMNSRQAHNHAIELMEMVGIPEPHRRIDEYPHQFSGGMRQRVMIAIALTCNPRVLIADEPTTALDVTIQAQILELIKRLQQELDMAVIIITHDLGVVAGVADRVNVMYGGRMVESGPTDEIFERPRMPYTIGLLRSVPRVDDDRKQRLVPIRGTPPDMDKPIPGCAFAPRCDFSKPVCREEAPALRCVAPSHKTACHFDVSLDSPTENVTREVG